MLSCPDWPRLWQTTSCCASWVPSTHNRTPYVQRLSAIARHETLGIRWCLPTAFSLFMICRRYGPACSSACFFHRRMLLTLWHCGVCAVQRAVIFRWNQCVYCSLSAAPPLHEAHDVASAVARPLRTWILQKTVDTLLHLASRSDILDVYIYTQPKQIAIPLYYFSYVVDIRV